jgi:hypothetical protein
LSNEKTKNSLSNKRGSSVKSIYKLALSIASDEANSAATWTSSTMLPMIMACRYSSRSHSSCNSILTLQTTHGPKPE